jgi:hypothetical protein
MSIEIYNGIAFVFAGQNEIGNSRGCNEFRPPGGSVGLGDRSRCSAFELSVLPVAQDAIWVPSRRVVCTIG